MDFPQEGDRYEIQSERDLTMACTKMHAKHGQLAFLTMSDRRGFYIYDALAFQPLADLGWAVDEVPWNAPRKDWRDYDAVVIRSTWDYQRHSDTFMDLLESITRQNIPLFNSAALVRWNMRKTYLQQLQNRGINIVPTRWCVSLAEPVDVAELCDHWAADELVVKPLIGANADDTYRIRRHDTQGWQSVVRVFARRPCMLQPFIRSILEQGEYSLFYFGGEYSHCVVKLPKRGDFRVQEEHGGTISACHPAEQLRAVGPQVIAALPEMPLYARVDLVCTPSSTWSVIEVELIEPSLYFPYDADAPFRFAAALDRALRGT